MTEILPAPLPLDYALGQPGARTPELALPSFADWLSAVPAAGRGMPEPIISDGAVVALPDSVRIIADDGAALTPLRAPAWGDAVPSPLAHAPCVRAGVDPQPLPGIALAPGIATVPGLQPAVPDPQPVVHRHANAESGDADQARDMAARAPLDQAATLGRDPISAGTVDLDIARLGAATAKIFNEDGFFMPAQPVAQADDAPDALRRVSVPAPETVPAPVADRARKPAFELTTAPIERDSGTAVGASSSRPARTPSVQINAPGPVEQATEPVATAALPEPEAELEPPLAATAPRWSSAAAQARAALRIAIRDLERGLQIIVAANTLDHQERERLASEIAGLLSRHGLLPRDVRVTGAHAQTGRNG